VWKGPPFFQATAHLLYLDGKPAMTQVLLEFPILPALFEAAKVVGPLCMSSSTASNWPRRELHDGDVVDLDPHARVLLSGQRSERVPCRALLAHPLRPRSATFASPISPVTTTGQLLINRELSLVSRSFH